MDLSQTINILCVVLAKKSAHVSSLVPSWSIGPWRECTVMKVSTTSAVSISTYKYNRLERLGQKSLSRYARTSIFTFLGRTGSRK